MPNFGYCSTKYTSGHFRASASATAQPTTPPPTINTLARSMVPQSPKVGAGFILPQQVREPLRTLDLIWKNHKRIRATDPRQSRQKTACNSPAAPPFHHAPRISPPLPLHSHSAIAKRFRTPHLYSPRNNTDETSPVFSCRCYSFAPR